MFINTVTVERQPINSVVRPRFTLPYRVGATYGVFDKYFDGREDHEYEEARAFMGTIAGYIVPARSVFVSKLASDLLGSSTMRNFGGIPLEILGGASNVLA